MQNFVLGPDGQMPATLRDRMQQLTSRERKYFQLMWSKSGVLYLTSKPGIAKSAMAREIASIMGFQYMDVRLAMVDETDVGLFPYLGDYENEDGSMCKVIDYAVPRWAIEANRKPTIIHFEELNRAQGPQRNAALQILLERQIGTSFKFNDYVLMLASGNMGDEDMTDVEEFDSALNNRLIHIPHSLGAEEWLENFAKEHCHNTIYSFIRAYPEKLYQNPTENTRAFATPRSWRFLSDMIITNFGKDSSPRDFLPFLQEVAFGFVGNSAQRFIQYLQEMVNISITDIINRYDQVEKELGKYNRDKNSELLQSLKEYDPADFNEKQLENVTKFLKRLGDDELTSYLLHILDDQKFDLIKLKYWLSSNFQNVLVKLKKMNRPETKN